MSGPPRAAGAARPCTGHGPSTSRLLGPRGPRSRRYRRRAGSAASDSARAGPVRFVRHRSGSRRARREATALRHASTSATDRTVPDFGLGRRCPTPGSCRASTVTRSTRHRRPAAERGRPGRVDRGGQGRPPDPRRCLRGRQSGHRRAGHAVHRFRIASNSKMITATVILQLVAEGVLSLDDAVLPRLAAPFRALGDGRMNDVTVRQLLNHTSGFEDFQAEFFRGQAVGARTSRWRRSEGVWSTAPGRVVNYSNENFCLLGLLIEQVDRRRLRAVRCRTGCSPRSGSPTCGVTGNDDSAPGRSCMPEGPTGTSWRCSAAPGRGWPRPPTWSRSSTRSTPTERAGTRCRPNSPRRCERPASTSPRTPPIGSASGCGCGATAAGATPARSRTPTRWCSTSPTATRGPCS